MALAFAHLQIVLEPGGAVALAAALFRGAEIGGGDGGLRRLGRQRRGARSSPRRSAWRETGGGPPAADEGASRAAARS